MESYLKEEMPINTEGVIEKINENMGKKVLIATVYGPEPVLLAATKLGAEMIILLIDKEPDKVQEASIKLIQDSLGKVMEIKIVKTDVYDIVEVARKAVEIIDLVPNDDPIFVNITSGRKTKAIGLLLAAYARHDKVSKIAYYPEDDKNTVVYLPRLSFKLSDNQKKILELIEKGKYNTINELADKMDISTAMTYRVIDELKDIDLVITDDGVKLTDAGRIARL